MADVEAMIFLCRLVRDRCPSLWTRFLRYGDKGAAKSFVEREDAFLLTEFFPTKTGQFVVTAIGSNPTQPNIEYCYNLAVDPAELRDLTDTELAGRLSQRPRPLRKVKTNAAPCLCPLAEAPAASLGGLDHAEIIRRARVVHSDTLWFDGW